MNINNINEAVYLHSYNRYMNSFKLTRLNYWARVHKLAATGLNKTNLIHKHLGVV